MGSLQQRSRLQVCQTHALPASKACWTRRVIFLHPLLCTCLAVFVSGFNASKDQYSCISLEVCVITQDRFLCCQVQLQL